jgi:hypothetical protein
MFILIPFHTRRIGLNRQKKWLQILVWLLKGVITLEEGLFLMEQKLKATRLFTWIPLKKSQYNM